MSGLGRRRRVQVVALAVLVLCAGLGGWSEAGEVPALTAEQLVERMQGRADRVGSLSGVLARRVTAPIEGAREGDPFRFRAPGSFCQLRGWEVSEPGAEPEQVENAWQIVRGSEQYRRTEGRTYRVEPGSRYRDLAYEDAPETLLVANLMPAAWFGAFEEDLRVGPVEQVEGEAYYTLLDVEKRVYGPGELVRYPELSRWDLRRGRRYYVNAETYVCERVALGRKDRGHRGEAGLESPTGDVIASQVEPAGGGGLLPLAYERRFFGDGGISKSVEVRLEDLQGRSEGSFGDSDFSPEAMSPGGRAVVLYPRARHEELRRLAREEPSPGVLLSLAGQYGRLRQCHGEKGLAVLERADELFAGEDLPEEYWQIRAEVELELQRALVRRTLQEGPQMVRIYRRRAERFHRQGDDPRARKMEERADGWTRKVEEAKRRIWELQDQ